LKNSPAWEESSIISYLQQENAEVDTIIDDDGSILDGQNVIIDDTPLEEDDPTLNVSPRQIVEDAAENPNADIDDRLEHMLNLINDPNQIEEPEDIVTTPEPADETSGGDTGNVVATVHYTTTTNTEVPLDPYLNYHIAEFDSSVKHDVYPSPETETMISWGIGLVASLMLIVQLLKIILNLSKNSSYFTMRQYKMKAVYALLRDLAIFVFVLAIALSLHFHSWLDFVETNIENLFYGIYIFLLVWIISSVLLLYTCYTQLETFYNYESISKDISQLQDLKIFYENAYKEANDGLLVEDPRNEVSSTLMNQMKFQVMRQAFINPVELPVLTESFLRRDFNFSMYLGYCITDFLSEIIGFVNLFVYFFIAFMLGIYRLINLLDVDLGSCFIYAVPLVCFIILFL